MVAPIEFEIVKRLIRPGSGNMPPEVARFFLDVRLDPSDEARITELSGKANEATLTATEEAELDSYLRVCTSLDILHAKARISLKAQTSAA
jgi:hypothetical protein